MMLCSYLKGVWGWRALCGSKGGSGDVRGCCTLELILFSSYLMRSANGANPCLRLCLIIAVVEVRLMRYCCLTKHHTVFLYLFFC